MSILGWLRGLRDEHEEVDRLLEAAGYDPDRGERIRYTLYGPTDGEHPEPGGPGYHRGGIQAPLDQDHRPR